MTLEKKNDEPIRVLHIIGNVCGGGVESVVMNYYRHMDRSKVQFDFVIDGYGKSLLDDEIKSLGGRVYKVEPYSRNLFKQIYQIRSIVKNNSYVIVHSHMNTLAIFSLFAAWWGGAKKRIVHNHSTATKGETLRTMMKYLLCPFAKVFANQYAACSVLAARWMFGSLVKKNKVVIFNNAIDLEHFSYNKSEREKYRAELGVGKDCFVIGHIGRFVYQKNHKFLIDIMCELVKKNKNTILLLIGDGPLYGEILDEVKRMGLFNKIRFLGLRKDVAELYNVMDVFVLPSWYEGLPVVSIEAQSNGLPCFVSNRVSDECQLTTTLYFMPLEHSAEQWAEEILRHPRKRNAFVDEELREAGFDIVYEAEKMQKFYTSLSVRGGGVKNL